MIKPQAPGRRLGLWRRLARPGLAGLALLSAGGAGAAQPVRLITLDPGHFHAALLQKEMLPGVDERVHVYAPLGPDLLAHLNRIAQFNSRAEHPTRWRLEIHTAKYFVTTRGVELARQNESATSGQAGGLKR